MRELKNKNILIGITGSIAAYKACDIIRLLRKNGSNVQAIMTKSSKQFIGKTTMAALTNNPVIDNALIAINRLEFVKETSIFPKLISGPIL